MVFLQPVEAFVEHEIRDRVEYFHRQRRDVRKNIELEASNEPAAVHMRSALSALISIRSPNVWNKRWTPSLMNTGK